MLGFTKCRGVCLLARFINYYDQYNAYIVMADVVLGGSKNLRSDVGTT